jgi:hypothetical protein
MAIVSLDSPSFEVPCLILQLVVYRDVTQQAKGLYRLKHVGDLKSGLAYLSQCNSSWFCHIYAIPRRAPPPPPTHGSLLASSDATPTRQPLPVVRSRSHGLDGVK